MRFERKKETFEKNVSPEDMYGWFYVEEISDFLWPKSAVEIFFQKILKN